jgi:hypothetical protein
MDDTQASLVAKMIRDAVDAERAACAKECRKIEVRLSIDQLWDKAAVADECNQAIAARGETP